MTSDFKELTDEEYALLQPIQKAQYQRAYNKHFGISKGASDEAFVSKKQLRDAIRDKCLECCCEQRGEIAQCRITKCPLWQHRPYQKMKIVDIEEEAA